MLKKQHLPNIQRSMRVVSQPVVRTTVRTRLRNCVRLRSKKSSYRQKMTIATGIATNSTNSISSPASGTYISSSLPSSGNASKVAPKKERSKYVHSLPSFPQLFPPSRSQKEWLCSVQEPLQDNGVMEMVFYLTTKNGTTSSQPTTDTEGHKNCNNFETPS